MHPVLLPASYFDYDQIEASTLHLGDRTVETHLKRIMDKLGLRTIAELTKYAIRKGLTSLDR